MKAADEDLIIPFLGMLCKNLQYLDFPVGLKENGIKEQVFK